MTIGNKQNIADSFLVRKNKKYAPTKYFSVRYENGRQWFHQEKQEQYKFDTNTILRPGDIIVVTERYWTYKETQIDLLMLVDEIINNDDFKIKALFGENLNIETDTVYLTENIQPFFHDFAFATDWEAEYFLKRLTESFPERIKDLYQNKKYLHQYKKYLKID